MTLRLLVSCGEASGELYGAELLRELHPLAGRLDAFGLGGDHLKAQGAELVAHVRDLAVVGLLEVVSHLRHIRRVYHRLLAAVDRHRPDAAVLVDYPDFNLRLAGELHRRGIPVVYYVSPQVWAWRRGRLAQMRRTLTRMLVIFPFEEAIYREAGIPVTFVGHPLVDLVQPVADRGAFLREMGLDPGQPVLAVLPGSRSKEIAHNLPVLADALRILRRRRPELQLLLALAPSIAPEAVAARLVDPALRVATGRTHAVLSSADAAVVASGTATVEAALLGTPMAVVYRVSPLTYHLGIRLVSVPHYAMVNLIAQRRVVPELMQRGFTADRVVAELLPLLEPTEKRATMVRDLRGVRDMLGAPGASRRAAEAVWDVLKNTMTPKKA